MSISDLTGIEGFTALNDLWCEGNLLTSLDLSQNTVLERLDCNSNQLASINLSQNITLTNLVIWENLLTSLDLAQNPALTTLICSYNSLTSLDVSQNTALNYLVCNVTQLSCLNIKNGNNVNFLGMLSDDNPSLTCIEVDNATWATNNFTQIDAASSFSEDCNNACSLSLTEFSLTPKQLLRIVDFMGRETIFKTNTLLIYQYSDGTSEKVYRIE